MNFSNVWRQVSFQPQMIFTLTGTSETACQTFFLILLFLLPLRPLLGQIHQLQTQFQPQSMLQGKYWTDN